MKQTPQAFSFWGAIIENSALHCHHSIHPFLQVFKFFFKKKKSVTLLSMHPNYTTFYTQLAIPKSHHRNGELNQTSCASLLTLQKPFFSAKKKQV